MMPPGIDKDQSSLDKDILLIREHYEAFNQRHLDAAARLFHADAPLQHVTGCVEIGPAGYRAFATRWLDAFPDAVLDVRDVHRRSPGLYEVDLVATGTHAGTLALGAWSFRATQLRVRIGARELLQIEDALIRSATLSFDVQDLVRQLAVVDTAKLLERLQRVQQLSDQLSAVQHDPTRAREVIERLGRLLDEARHIVRPYFR